MQDAVTQTLSILNYQHTAIDMAHESTVLPSRAQKGKAAEASSSCQHEQRDKEEALPSVEVVYPKLDVALRELKKGRKARKYSVPTARHHERTGKDDAGTPYDIVNVEQLQRWAEVEPEQFLEALNTLREQRDLGMTVSEGVHDLLIKKNDLMDVITEQQDRVASLKTSFTALNTKYQLLKERQQTEREGTYSSNISNSLNGGKRSQKLPDPPLLDDGSEPTWEDWVGKMKAKLSVNKDHYPTEIARMGYVLSRLSGKAAQHTESRSPYGFSVADPYHDVNEILKDLREIYEDPDKQRNYRRAYIELIQGSKRFSDFYVEFRRLFTFFKYGEAQCIDDLRDKISLRLQASLSSQMVQPDLLSIMKTYLIRLDNKQRAARAAKDRRDTNIIAAPAKEVKTFKQVTFGVPATQPMVRSAIPLNSLNSLNN